MSKETSFEAEFTTKDTHLAHRGEQLARMGLNAGALFAVFEHFLESGQVARGELSNDEGREWHSVEFTATSRSLSWTKVAVPADKTNWRRFRVRLTLAAK